MLSISLFNLILSRFNLRLGLSVLSCGFSGFRLASITAATDENLSEFFEVDNSIATLVVVTKDRVHILQSNPNVSRSEDILTWSSESTTPNFSTARMN